MKKILIIIVVIIILIGVYFYSAIKKFTYDYKVVSYKLGYVDLANGNATINLTLQVTINSSLPFKVPVNSLYYEVYYQNTLLAKSINASTFVIEAKPNPTTITQDISINVNKKDIQVAINYMKKIPTEYTVKVIANISGININIGNIKFTY